MAIAKESFILERNLPMIFETRQKEAYTERQETFTRNDKFKPIFVMNQSIQLRFSIFHFKC